RPRGRDPRGRDPARFRTTGGPPSVSARQSVSTEDLDAVESQLGRRPRGVLEIAYRSPDGRPGVVTTAPRLDDGTPFPTLYYLTDPRLTAEASRQESPGIMRTMTTRLTTHAELAAIYRYAHERFLAQRNACVELRTHCPGGGMPERVKCLHVLMACALAAGPGVVGLCDESVALAAATGLRGTATPEDWPTPEER